MADLSGSGDDDVLPERTGDGPEAQMADLSVSEETGDGPEAQMRDLSGYVLGDYRLRARIGGGGNGDVYRAEHLKLRRVAVVKVLNEQRRWAYNEAAARFRREAQLASQLSHDNAARVYEFGVDVIDESTDDEEEVMWIAMEFVNGITFAKWLKAHGTMSVAEVVQFFGPLLGAVGAAHQCEIVHRDLKPSNVMVVEIDGVPVPKLIDFGIAKGTVGSIAEDEPVEHPGDKRATDLIRATRSPRYYRTNTAPGLPARVPEHRRKITPSGVGFGSRAYMSPEQSGDAARVGPAADIYSLGVMLCEALTGRLPFKADDTDGYLRVHLHAVPDIYLPTELERVLYRALSKDPEQRQASARELREALEEVLKSDPNAQIQSLAQRWHERGRSPDLLARGATLMELKRSVQSPRVAARLSKLDDSFLKMSMQRARRAKWELAALIALIAMGGLLVRADGQRRTAYQAATESEVERGQQALLHGELNEAVGHLEQAYQRGERSPGVKFMLARALQPRMSESARFSASSGRMWSAVFAPDGKRVLTSDDKGARMWDAASSQLLFTMNHGDTVYAAAAVFSSDGSKIVTAGADGTVRIWSAASGALVRQLRDQRQGSTRWRYYGVAVSSHFVAAIDLTGKTVHVWDAETGAQVAELGNDAPGVALIAFSSDGRWLASSGRDEVRVFDTMTWRQAVTIVGPRVRSLSFDPTGLRLAVGTYDGMASVWEIPTGVRVRSLRDPGGASVDVVAFSRDGVLVATASRDGTVQVWSVASGGLRTQFKSHRDKIYAVEFSLTGDVMLSAGADGVVAISNVATGMPVARLEGAKSVVIAAHFDPESRRVVGASWDGNTRVWDAASPYRRWGAPVIGAECDTEESLVPDQRYVAISCRNHDTHVWDTMRGELLAKLPSITAVDGNYSSALPALTATGDRAAIARGNTVEVYALPSGQFLRTITHPAAVNAVAFGPAGHDLVSGAVDGSLWLTLDDGDPSALPMSSVGIDAVAILADGRVVAADASKRLRIFGPDRSAPLMDVLAPSRIRLLRPSPDGRRLVAISIASEMAPPMLWDLDKYRLTSQLEGHTGRVFTARFVAHGGREILTVGSDGNPRLWDAATGRPGRSFRGDGHVLVDAALAPDGSMIVAGGSDGFVRFWDTSNGRLLWMLQAHRSYVIGVHYEGNDLVTRGLAGDIASWALPAPDGLIEACRARACGGTDAKK
jgi:WD40 repeat protein/serine/threonine protein kinase